MVFIILCKLQMMEKNNIQMLQQIPCILVSFLSTFKVYVLRENEKFIKSSAIMIINIHAVMSSSS